VTSVLSGLIVGISSMKTNWCQSIRSKSREEDRGISAERGKKAKRSQDGAERDQIGQNGR
jgi:hypothetical protein